MDGFVPYSVAATQTGYSYTMIRQLARDHRVTTRAIYGRQWVNLADVIAYQEAQAALGPAKHTPRKYRPETADA
ncbi:MAG TPA: hypothetical protein PKH77_28385 [Anaerolineae bacterium]|nr:hypothetical protein [Anaerolineae bacterium]